MYVQYALHHHAPSLRLYDAAKIFLDTKKVELSLALPLYLFFIIQLLKQAPKIYSGLHFTCF